MLDIAANIYDVVFYSLYDLQYFLLKEQTPYRIIPHFEDYEKVMHLYKYNEHTFSVVFHKDTNGVLTLLNGINLIE